MPGRDKTGPLGAGPLTGGGLGLCRAVLGCGAGLGLGLGLGLACKRGFRRGAGSTVPTDAAAQKARLAAQRDALRQRLADVERQLETAE